MTGHDLKRWIAALVCIWLLPWSQPLVAQEPPGAGCIDLHDLSGGWRTGEREILIQSNGQAGARLELDPACPAFAEGVDLETLAPEGWACPGGSVFVRGDDTTCPVIRMSALSEQELGEALRTWNTRIQADVPTLDSVEVRGRRPHWRDRTGTTDQCVDVRFLRGWRYSNAEGLVVDVAPRRHSGNRYYRVETAETCSDLSSVQTIKLESRIGAAAICGRPGDTVVLFADTGAPGGFAQMGGPLGAGTRGRDCTITRVTPLPRK